MAKALDWTEAISDKVGGGLDIGSNSLGLASAFTDGKTSDGLGIAGGAVGIGSGLAGAINGGANMLKCDGSDNAGLASGALGMLGGGLSMCGGLSDIGAGVAGLSGDNRTKRGFGIASGVIGSLGGILGAVKGGIDMHRAKKDIAAAQAILDDDSKSEDEKKKAREALEDAKKSRGSALNGILGGVAGGIGGLIGAFGAGFDDGSGTNKKAEAAQKWGAAIGNGGGILSSLVGLTGFDGWLGGKVPTTKASGASASANAEQNQGGGNAGPEDLVADASKAANNAGSPDTPTEQDESPSASSGAA